MAWDSHDFLLHRILIEEIVLTVLHSYESFILYDLQLYALRKIFKVHSHVLSMCGVDDKADWGLFKYYVSMFFAIFDPPSPLVSKNKQIANPP